MLWADSGVSRYGTGGWSAEPLPMFRTQPQRPARGPGAPSQRLDRREMAREERRELLGERDAVRFLDQLVQLAPVELALDFAARALDRAHHRTRLVGAHDRIGEPVRDEHRHADLCA